MRRSVLVSGIFSVLAFSSIYVPAATADPIVESAHRRVIGYTQIGVNATTAQHVLTDATSGPFVAHIAELQTTLDATAAFEASQDTMLSPYAMGGSGSASTTTTTLNPSDAIAYGDSYFYAFFTLDGDYNYDFSGFISAASSSPGTSFAQAWLYSYNAGVIHNLYIYDGVLPFSYLGTLDEGYYEFLLYANANGYSSVPLGNADFDALLTLSPVGVPDTADAAMMFVLGSILLGAFALQHRRRVS